MIILKADAGLKTTFDRLIQMMDAPVKWSGRFVVVDNYLILQGELRSLFFHFDSKKVVTNLIDLDLEGKEQIEVAEHEQVKNAINIILYAFGKWGNIKGLKVEKNYEQLSRLFQQILDTFHIEGVYSQDGFQFYQNKIKVTYEDVIWAAIEYKEAEAPEQEIAEESGLWHKLLWKKHQTKMKAMDTTLEERKSNRIGNNFYLVGYLCPSCGAKMHMVVYPAGKEFVIETEAGRVKMARAYTCEHCCSFYTPYPKKLLAEGDLFWMNFEKDRPAYEDYQELLGRDGERVSNYKYNEFVNKQHHGLEKPGVKDVAEKPGEGDSTAKTYENEVEGNSRITEEQKKKEAEQIAHLLEELPELSDDDFNYFVRKIEDGFYPDSSVEKMEGQVKKQQKYRRRHPSQQENTSEENASEENASEKKTLDSKKQAIIKRYNDRIAVFPRLSERQRKELSMQISGDKQIDDAEKRKLFTLITKEQQVERQKQLQNKIEENRNKNYAVIAKLYEEVENADLDGSAKQGMLMQLEHLKNERATAEEVKQTEQKAGQINQESEQDEKGSVQQNQSHIHMKQSAEQKNQNSMQMEQNLAQANGKNDILEGQKFSPKSNQTYSERDIQRRREIDQRKIDKICENAATMPFEDVSKIYEEIKLGDFLPELKSNALELLEKRLMKIKTDECELLVLKLKEGLEKAGIPNNPRHYFYPARKVMLKQNTKAETEVIDFALASYAAGIGKFEYPILVVDTSRNKSGKEGMILTPENLFYSTLMTAYHIPLASISEIKAVNGLLNKGLMVIRKNGAKVKLPAAVEGKELSVFAEQLSAFVKYLQEKPFSRKETYLAKNKHDTICCFRCGFVYKEGNVCPKCGYKMNE